VGAYLTEMRNKATHLHKIACEKWSQSKDR